ncbi:MAG: GntR family transcriptional regulator, partial [Bacteroidales bacterium]|nr:GntR family transcriptional regulator [Bacteroidales bacterium]
MNINNLSLQNIERPPKLSQQVETQLRDAIVRKVFNESDNLPSEKELCKIFGVSRNVIREALSTLSTKGMIEISKGKCAIVREPTINTVLDPFSQLLNYKCGNKGLEYILTVRNIIEPPVASLSAQNRSNENLQEMKQYLDSMRETNDDMAKNSHWDIQF